MYFTNVDRHLIKNDNVRWNVAYRDPGIVTCTCQNFSAYNVLFSSIYTFSQIESGYQLSCAVSANSNQAF